METGGKAVEQNTIAVIWDFDKTLIPSYMQEPIFRKYGVDGEKFWKESNDLVEEYKCQGVKVNEDTIYLNHILTCVKQGVFKGLNNRMLRELGDELEFYNGVPEIFQELKDVVAKDENFRLFGIHVEHYIVSTGMTEMIKGSKIYQYVDGVWGCEFIESPIRTSLGECREPEEEERVLRQTGYIVDNTSKTKAIFEINKGGNKIESIKVNSKIAKDDRRVPFENMIYIADGPSDVPVFSVLKQYGGRTFAIYPKGKVKQFSQVNNLIRDGRIDMFAEADYSRDTTAYMWLTENVREIAQRICAQNLENIKDKVGEVPTHVTKE